MNSLGVQKQGESFSRVQMEEYFAYCFSCRAKLRDKLHEIVISLGKLPSSIIFVFYNFILCTCDSKYTKVATSRTKKITFSTLPRNPWKDHVECCCFINNMIVYGERTTFNLFYQIVLHSQSQCSSQSHARSQLERNSAIFFKRDQPLLPHEPSKPN